MNRSELIYLALRFLIFEIFLKFIRRVVMLRGLQMLDTWFFNLLRQNGAIHNQPQRPYVVRGWVMDKLTYDKRRVARQVLGASSYEAFFNATEEIDAQGLMWLKPPEVERMVFRAQEGDDE